MITKEELKELEILWNKAKRHCVKHDCEKCVIDNNDEVCKNVRILIKEKVSFAQQIDKLRNGSDVKIEGCSDEKNN